VLESIDGFGSLAVVKLCECFKGLFSAVCSIILQCFGVCMLDSKAGYVSMDYVEPGVDSSWILVFSFSSVEESCWPFGAASAIWWD